jgi:phosphoglycerate dehydrogenase-like enzyme
MKIWKNTNTLAGFDTGLTYTSNKSIAEIALLGSKPFEIDEFPNLKGIFRAGIGKDNVPFEAAEKRNIRISFPAPETVDLIFEETANFTCGLILRMLYTDVGTLDPWFKESRLQLSDKKLLLVGKGNIGSRVYQKMSQFMIVDTYDALSDHPRELSKKLPMADCVSLHIPNTIENRSFIDNKKLSLMKDGAVLINTARGAIVDEDSLYEEISAGRLNAAFDVYWQEPYLGKLKEFHPDGFFMTPHVASTCSGFLRGCRSALDLLIEDIQNA